MLFPELGQALPREGAKLPEEVDWRAIAQPALLLIGIPSAFVLWSFRDFNAQANLENQRKDVNLKEFQEIQMRAAGAMEKKLPEGARQTLQIAATHQLAGFLRGEYGASFQRPAWELLRARLLASSQRMGYRAVREQITGWHAGEPDDRMPAGNFGVEIRKAVRSISLDSTGKAQRDVVRDEWRTIFGKGLPLTDTNFDGIIAPNYAFLAKRDLARCSFLGADLRNAHLEGADLENVSLDSNTILEGAQFDDATRFSQEWNEISEVEKEAHRDRFRALGMKHIDDARAQQDKSE